MNRIYDWIEEMAWRCDNICHEVIEWAEHKRTGKTLTERWNEFASQIGVKTA